MGEHIRIDWLTSLVVHLYRMDLVYSVVCLWRPLPSQNMIQCIPYLMQTKQDEKNFRR